MSSLTIRPTSAAMQEPQTETHYLPKDPHLLLQADPSRRQSVSFLSDRRQVNRLKLLKRQSYGRAGFNLLRHRVLARSA